MAAFDRIQSGIPEMDAAIDNIRLGDSVLFRISSSFNIRCLWGLYGQRCQAGER